jgi:O-antigen/teichoic acid export membrane protein
MIHAIKAWLTQQFEHIFENPLFRRVVKNSGYLFSTTGISAALSMLQGILVARLLGVDKFGMLGTIITFTSVVNKLASFRMSELVIKYVGDYSENDDPLNSAAVYKISVFVELITSLVAYGIIYIIAPLGALYLTKDPSTTHYFQIYGIIILSNMIVESSTGLLQIFDRFQRVAITQLGGSIFTLLIVILVYSMKGDLPGILLAYMGGKSLSALWLSSSALLEASKQWGKNWWHVSLKRLKPQIPELAHFAIHTNISATISLFTKDSEILWVSLFRNNVEAGYYKLALSLANIVQLPISPLPQATYPELSRQAAQKNWGNMRYIMRQGSLLAGFYSLVAIIFLLFFGRFVIANIYSPEYIPAYPALIILLVGYLIANLFYWRRPVLLSLGHPEFPTKVNAILAAIKFMGVVLFVPRYGYLASSALLSGFYWVGSIVNIIKIRILMREQGTTI